jgi:transcriptional regulator with XRE-family HTH domain
MRPSKNVKLMEALALEVKLRRQQLDLTQEDLAGRCDLDRPYISLIEVARKQPTLSVLLRLADGLDLSLSALLGRVQRRYQRDQR